MTKKPVMLMILDGWGIAPDSPTNAATRARTPNLTKLFATCPHTELVCSGEAVGLPEGQMGNSEVGHTNIGAGRLVYQSLELINSKIKDGSFYSNDEFLKVMITDDLEKTVSDILEDKKGFALVYDGKKFEGIITKSDLIRKAF